MNVILDKILNDLGNGKAKIIECNKENDVKNFLFFEVKNEIKERLNNCLFFEFYNDGSSKKDIFKELENINKIYQNNRTIILICDLFSFCSPEAIINLFYGNKNVDVIISSNIEVSYKLKNKDTEIRGRYISYFVDPTSFTSINENILHIKPLENYKYKDEAIELYKYLLNHSGEVLTYRSICDSSKIKKDLYFYIKTIEYMNKTKMIYLLEIKNIKDLKKKAYGFIVYPTFIFDLELSDLTYDKKFRLNKESIIVSKLISYGFLVSYAISFYGDYVNNKYITRNVCNAGFLIESYSRKSLIKICFNNDTSIERFIKLKTKIPQIIIVLSNMNLKVDDNGMIYYGLNNFLADGLKNYGKL